MVPWAGLQYLIVVYPGHTHCFFARMDAVLDRNNTHRYVDVTKLSVRQSNNLDFPLSCPITWKSL